MASQNRTNDPGTGTRYSSYSKRIINKNGSFNVIKKGLPPSSRNAYQYLIQIGWTSFLGIVVLYLLAINAIFATIYYLSAPPEFAEGWMGFNRWLECYFFSFQTFTTVGYGAMAPVGIAMGVISSFESIFGWISFAIITGILYGRFSRPSARLMYSTNALIAPHKDGKALHFRIANKRRSTLMEMEATVLLMTVQRDKEGKGILERNFQQLKLQINRIIFFPLNWTIVHPIDEKSPLFEKSASDLKEMDAEILIMIKGFDDTFSQVVHSRYSYKWNEIVWNARFEMAYNTIPSGDIELYFDLLDKYRKV